MAELSDEQREALEKQKQNCIFCKIIAGQAQAKKVYEDEKIIAIMDINPCSEGHILVMPKEHYPIMPLIPPDEFDHLFKHVKKLSGCLKKALLAPATNIFIANGAVAGQMSQHFMLHIIPRDEDDGISVFDIGKGDAIEQQAQDEAYKTISHNLPLMLANHLRRWPTKGIVSGPDDQKGEGGQGDLPKQLSREQVIKVIDANPPLKEMLIKSPEMLKQQIGQNPQLKMLFENLNLEELRKEFLDKEKKKSSTDVDLDSISDLL